MELSRHDLRRVLLGVGVFGLVLGPAGCTRNCEPRQVVRLPGHESLRQTDHLDYEAGLRERRSRQDEQAAGY